jgi:uncharacterized repeat protein (TIGR03803 family)
MPHQRRALDRRFRRLCGIGGVQREFAVPLERSTPMSRLSAFLVASAVVAVTGCSGATAFNLAPPFDSSSSLADAAVKVTILHSFMGGSKDGSTPISGLARVGSLFYGTTGGGGKYDKGMVFSISPNGTGFTVLYDFQGKGDGRGSAAGLTNAGGTLYGTTQDGGTKGSGTVFSITTAGAFATIYSFKGGASDGAKPMAAMTNVGGTLYGTTADGGSVDHGACTNCGTVFSISTSGQEKVRYFFGSKKDDGISPQSPLVRLGGKLYGTTTNGGNGGVTGNGTVFSVTTSGKEVTLYRFKNDSDGSCSFNCYLTDLAGTLYGTARLGGKSHVGSVFSITPAGAFKTLYSASTKGNGGGEPSAALTNVAGTLYGTMGAAPVGKDGTVFSITTAGRLTAIYTFTGGDDGARPASRLSFVGGKLYGTTAKGGGSKDAGIIYTIAGF